MRWPVDFDPVELIMAVEDEFGISIPDEEFEHIHTMGEMYAYLMNVTNTPDAKGRCLTQRAFYKLRRSLVSIFGFERRSIKRTTPTDTLFPKDKRRKTWDRLGKALEVNCPQLKRPLWLIWTLVLTVLFCMLAIPLTLAGVFFIDDPSIHIAATVVTGVLLGALLERVTRPFAVEIPAQCQTIGGLATALARKDWHEAVEEPNLNRKVWDRLCATVLKCPCIDESHLEPETDFRKIDDVTIAVKLFGR